jgi:hypothetical protein
MADNHLAQTWRSRIADCEQSGLSIQRWCGINGTSSDAETSLYVPLIARLYRL